MISYLLALDAKLAHERASFCANAVLSGSSLSAAESLSLVPGMALPPLPIARFIDRRTPHDAVFLAAWMTPAVARMTRLGGVPPHLTMWPRRGLKVFLFAGRGSEGAKRLPRQSVFLTT